MKNNRNILALFSLAILFMGLTACTKKCIVETEDTNNGAIISGVVVYPSAGSLTGNMGGNYVITTGHPHANEIQIRVNEGEKTNVNYSDFTVLCYPTTANCSAFYDKTVTIDDANQTVVYKIVVTQCESCPEKYTSENYVLVPAFPSNYAVSYDVSYVTK